MTSIIQSSMGDYLVIKPEVIEQFMDLTAARDRVERIAETNGNLAEDAREIMRRLEAAKHW